MKKLLTSLEQAELITSHLVKDNTLILAYQPRDKHDFDFISQLNIEKRNRSEVLSLINKEMEDQYLRAKRFIVRHSAEKEMKATVEAYRTYMSKYEYFAKS